MTACERCGIDGGFLYLCPECGGQYCDEHQSADAHECVMVRGGIADADGTSATGSSGLPEGKSVGISAAAACDESDEEASATATEDDDPDGLDEKTADPESPMNGEDGVDPTDDNVDQAEAGGVLGRIPRLGRFIG